jgi:uncharacterized protein YndB with AHSA1/START domain
MADYHVVTEWRAAAPRQHVWSALLDYREWPAWWRGFRKVDRLRAGDDQGVGMILRQQWRSLLPYTLTFELEILEIESAALLRGRISGDMDGTATWTMDEAAGETRIRFVLDVHPARPWMNLPVPFAGRIFAANYDAVMRWGSEGLARRLEAGVADWTAQARLAGA